MGSSPPAGDDGPHAGARPASILLLPSIRRGRRVCHPNRVRPSEINFMSANEIRSSAMVGSSDGASTAEGSSARKIAWMRALKAGESDSEWSSEAGDPRAPISS